MPKVSVNAPRTPVTEDSSGTAAATLPNMCKMPGPPAPFVPTPLPNIGKSGSSPKKYSKSVTIGGKKVAIRGATFGSAGDVASKGTGGGLVSANVEGPTSFAGPGSMNVKIEGKSVQLLGDPMLNNCGPSGNPTNSATLMGVIQAPDGLVIIVTGTDACPVCDDTHDQQGGLLKETQESRADANQLFNELSSNNAANKDSPEKCFPKRVAASGKMLGVARCACGQRYAEHSGTTESVFCQVVQDKLKWHISKDDSPNVEENGGLIDEDLRVTIPKSTVTLRDGRAVTTQNVVQVAKSTRLTRVKRHINRLLEGNAVKQYLVNVEWVLATEYVEQSQRNNDIELPAAYPPGACAGPKALVLALEEGAYVDSLTELWFHRAGLSTHGAIEYYTDKGVPVMKSFKHGEAVPPCKTCSRILPWLLCTKERESACQHKAKK